MKVRIWVHCMAAVALVCSIGSLEGSARAEEPDADNTASPGVETPPAEKSANKDPIASAFALPKGVKLNAKQKAAYDRLKAEKTPDLQQAIDDLQKSKSGTPALAKKVRDCRTEIHDAIDEIVYGVGPAAAGPGSGYGGGNYEGSGGYAVPYGAYPVPVYGGYYPHRPFGGYYPYPNYDPRWREGKGKYATGGPNGSSSGTKGGGSSTDRKHPPASRPATGSPSNNTPKR